MFDKKLPNILARAIEQPGFAMLDVWELCTAYYSPRNELKKKELFDLLKEYGLEEGLIVDKPRPEYSVRYREAYETGKNVIKPKVPIEPEFPNSIDKQTGVIVAGSAGQKIKSTATLFAQAAMSSGLEATQKDDYPITVMTGHSLAEIIISREPIEYTEIDEPEYFVLISEDGLKRARARIEKLPSTCILFAEESLELPETSAKVVRFPLVRTARSIDKTAVAVVALAAMLEETKIFPTEALEAVISKFQKPLIAQTNLKAVRAGVDMTGA
jgi:Pyruvate/2-oxoacid:ferredoxin oxidoreductase gamma subunit